MLSALGRRFRQALVVIFLVILAFGAVGATAAHDAVWRVIHGFIEVATGKPTIQVPKVNVNQPPSHHKKNH